MKVLSAHLAQPDFSNTSAAHLRGGSGQASPACSSLWRQHTSHLLRRMLDATCESDRADASCDLVQCTTLYNSEMAPARLRGGLNILFQVHPKIFLLRRTAPPFSSCLAETTSGGGIRMVARRLGHLDPGPQKKLWLPACMCTTCGLKRWLCTLCPGDARYPECSLH